MSANGWRGHRGWRGGCQAWERRRCARIRRSVPRRWASRAPRAAGLDLGACPQPLGEALAVESGVANGTERIHIAACAAAFDAKSALNSRGARLRMRPKARAGSRACCLTSALGGPYPDTQVAGDLTSFVGGDADSLT